MAMVATVKESIKHRALVCFSVDGDGDWHAHHRDVVFVSHALNKSSFASVIASALDLWGYDYAPRDGDCIVDVGAGIGDDVVVFSRLVGSAGHVLAIEAHPVTFRCLAKTIAANYLRNVTAVQVAVGCAEGVAQLSDNQDSLGNSIVDGQGTIPVRVRPLDDIINELVAMPISLLKMNIEGAETAALIGMRDTLHNTAHVVVACHDFKYARGESLAFATCDDVRHILIDRDFCLRQRKEDPRPYVRDYLYGSKVLTPSGATQPAREGGGAL